MHFQNIFLIPSSSNALGDMKLINFQVIWKSSNKSLSRLGENPISSIGWYILAKIGNFVKMGHWAAHQYLREASSKRKRFESQNFWKPKPPTAYCGAFLFLMSAFSFSLWVIVVFIGGRIYCHTFWSCITELLVIKSNLMNHEDRSKSAWILTVFNHSSSKSFEFLWPALDR